MQPKEMAAQEFEATFIALADRLEAKSQIFSFIGQMADHLADHQIVEMGEEAIPLVLSRPEQQGGPWYRALECITGVPSTGGITALAAGGGCFVDEVAVNAAWLQWGRERGIQW